MRSMRNDQPLTTSRLATTLKVMLGFFGFVALAGIISKLAIALENEPSDSQPNLSDDDSLALTPAETTQASFLAFTTLNLLGAAAVQLQNRMPGRYENIGVAAPVAEEGVIKREYGSDVCGNEIMVTTENSVQAGNPQMKTAENGDRYFTFTALGNSSFSSAKMRISVAKKQDWLGSEFELGSSIVYDSEFTSEDESCSSITIPAYKEVKFDVYQEFSRPALIETSGKMLATFQEQLLANSQLIDGNFASYRSINETTYAPVDNEACSVKYSGNVDLTDDPVEMEPTGYATIDIATVILKNRYDASTDCSYIELSIADTEEIDDHGMMSVTAENTYLHLASQEQRAFCSTVARLFDKLAIAAWAQGVKAGDKWGVNAQALVTTVNPLKKGTNIHRHGETIVLVTPSSDNPTMPRVAPIYKQGAIENALALVWVEYKKETDSYTPKVKLCKKGSGNSFIVGKEFEVHKAQPDSIQSIDVAWNAVSEQVIIVSNSGDGHGDGVLLTFMDIDTDNLTLKYSDSQFANTCTEHNQAQGSIEVAPDESGEFTVSWADQHGIFAQRFNSDSGKIDFYKKNNDNSSNGSSLSAGGIIGVSFGIAVGVAILGRLGLFAWERCRKSDYQPIESQSMKVI